MSQIAGPSLGGFLVQALKAPYAVAADAFSFLWSASWVTAIRAREPEPVKPEQRNLGKEIGEGLRFVLGHPILRKIAGCTGSFNLCSSATFALEILFLVRIVHLSPGGIGLLFSIGSDRCLARRAYQRRIASARAGPNDLGQRSSLRRPDCCFRRHITTGGSSYRRRHLRRLVRHDRLQRRAGELPAGHLPSPAAGADERDDAIPGVGHQPIGGLLGGWLGTAFGLRTALWIAAAAHHVAPLWVIFSPLRKHARPADRGDQRPA